ncbi:Nif3-like dinuclear metal center hexameric protein [Ningiella sp. W23]|uniref:Nif3-like dinuclear metal center hexameric protein n=1 Tax=Ningiella sp. W23 TaxID=3023715 RepID=UPI003757861A
MHREELLSELDTLLSPALIKDYCPNGLQVEGKAQINKVVTGVTASQALIESAIKQQADAILVHHGYFWKNEPYSIVGMKKRRISRLLQHDINLFAYHLPLDVHPSMGNNAMLGKVLGISAVRPIETITPEGIVMVGELSSPASHAELAGRFESALGRKSISIGNKDTIRRLAWCTGGGQGYIDHFAALQGDSPTSHHRIDAFISGEISEQTTHSARELDIDYFALGHHATERYGVKTVGEYLQSTFGLEVSFVDIDNPA